MKRKILQKSGSQRRRRGRQGPKTGHLPAGSASMALACAWRASRTRRRALSTQAPWRHGGTTSRLGKGRRSRRTLGVGHARSGASSATSRGHAICARWARQRRHPLRNGERKRKWRRRKKRSCRQRRRRKRRRGGGCSTRSRYLRGKGRGGSRVPRDCRERRQGRARE